MTSTQGLFKCPKCEKVLNLYYTDIALVEEGNEYIAVCEECYFNTNIYKEVTNGRTNTNNQLA